MQNNNISTCLKDLVGITHPNLCPSTCIPEVEELPVSESGYYLNGMDEGGVDLSDLHEAFKCRKFQESVTFWDFAEDIICESIDEFALAFDGALAENKTRTTSDIHTIIGDQRNTTGPYSESGQYAVAKLSPRVQTSGLAMTITEVKLWMHGAPSGEAFEVFVYADNDLTTPIDSVTIAVSPKGEASVDWCLPLCNSHGDTTYYFVYDTKGYSPRNTKWNCNCGGGLNAWERVLKAGAAFVDDITDLDSIGCNSVYSSGLAFTASICCDPISFLCNMGKCRYKNHVARAIQLILRRKASGFIASSDKISQLVNKKIYAERLSYYNAQIEHSLQYLAQNYTQDYSGCFLCEDGPFMTIDSISI